MDYIQTANKQVDKFGAGKHGFSAGNPTTGILATLLSNTWCDGVQEEIINVIEAAGIAPSGASLAQLLLALRSAGVFQTPAQFDNTTKVATTAFVQRALGNSSGVSLYTASLTLPLSDAGKLILVDASSGPIVITIPSGLPDGATFKIKRADASNNTLTVSSGDTRVFIDQANLMRGIAVTSVSLGKLDGLGFIYDSRGYFWGDGSFGGAVFATNGWNKLPNGLIFQWGQSSITSGTSVTFPLAFPNAVATLLGQVTEASVTMPVKVFDVAGLTQSGFLGYCSQQPISGGSWSAGTYTICWIAIGY